MSLQGVCKDCVSGALQWQEMDWYADWPRTLVGLTLGAGCLVYYLLEAAKVYTASTIYLISLTPCWPFVLWYTTSTVSLSPCWPSGITFYGPLSF